MKLAVLTDSHAGVRSDSTVFLDNAKKFYDNKFFPTIQEYGIKNVLHLGDILDRRKFINFVTANRLRRDFIEPLAELGLTLDHVLGNHDVYYKDRNDVSGVIELFGNTTFPINIITETQERVYDSQPVLLVPWICDENHERSLATIKASKARVCMGHLELNGFEMNKGSVMDHGMDASVFAKFDVVASGHFHHGSKKGGIHYLGATGEYDWGDWDDPRGFHIFDTETLEFTPIRNPYSVFHRIDYDDTGLEVDTVLSTINPERIQDCYVKVMVKAKTNPYLYDRFIDELEKAGVADLQIVEEYSAMQLMSSEEIMSQAEDTIEIMDKYVDGIQTTLDPKILTKILHETYREAVMVT